MFKLEIRTGGAAYRMEDDTNPKNIGDERIPIYENRLDPFAYELRKNLNDVIDKLKRGFTEGTIHDINGNKTGEWSLED